MDPRSPNPSDAVSAVSRLLASAGGSADAAAVQAAVVAEAARFFGVPAVLLLELEDADRRVRAVAGVGAEPKPHELHDVSGLPSLAELVASRAPRLAVTAEAALTITRALASGAPAEEGQLVALDGNVLLLIGTPPPPGCLDGPASLGAVFVQAASAALDRVRTAAVHAEHRTRQTALTRAAKTLNESLDLETLLGHICQESMLLLDADNAAIYHGTVAEGFRVGGVAGLPPEFVGWPLQPGTGLAGQVIEHARPLLTNDYPSLVSPPSDSPFRRVRSALAVPFG